VAFTKWFEDEFRKLVDERFPGGKEKYLRYSCSELEEEEA
jgi:hypothetical protein